MWWTGYSILSCHSPNMFQSRTNCDHFQLYCVWFRTISEAPLIVSIYTLQRLVFGKFSTFPRPAQAMQDWDDMWRLAVTCDDLVFQHGDSWEESMTIGVHLKMGQTTVWCTHCQGPENWQLRDTHLGSTEGHCSVMARNCSRSLKVKPEMWFTCTTDSQESRSRCRFT